MIGALFSLRIPLCLLSNPRWHSLYPVINPASLRPIPRVSGCLDLTVMSEVMFCHENDTRYYVICGNQDDKSRRFHPPLSRSLCCSFRAWVRGDWCTVFVMHPALPAVGSSMTLSALTAPTRCSCHS